MKGFLFTLEAVISILMILFIIVFLFQNPPTSPEYQILNYKYKAYHGVEVLDKRGDLRNDVVNNNATNIKTNLDVFIPDFLTYEVVIYNETTNVTEIPTSITSQNDTVISVSYLISGDINEYKPRDIRVYLWGFE